MSAFTRKDGQKENKLRVVLTEDFESKWVALSKDQSEVLGTSSSLSDLTKNIGEGRDVKYMKVPNAGASFMF